MPTPREVFETLSARFSSGSWDRIAGLYAEDAVAEIPFALPVPERIEGRAELHRRFTMLAAGTIDLKAENVRVHETADPEVVVAEFDYRGYAHTTGRSFRIANIQVLRIRDGLIRSTRDYHDHAALAVATGSTPALEQALDGAFTLDRAPAGA
jgi:uncharacterized protein